MNPKLILCLALVLSGGLFGCATNPPSVEVKVIKPREVELGVPDGIGGVTFWGQTNLYGAQIIWGGQDYTKPDPMPDADVSNIQMWLLQPDGTTVPQSEKPGVCWTGHLGFVHDEMSFTFTRVATNKVAGIVLRYRGKLYCKEIEAGE